MRVESSVTSISWIPSEAITGITKLPFELGVGHYDNPPPDRIDPGNLEALRDDDRFRFANHLRAWIEVEGGRVVDQGSEARGVLNNTHMKVGPFGVRFQAVGFPDLSHQPVVRPDSVRFRHSAGGRPGMPAPRRVGRRAGVQLVAPTVWTTLQLTLHADGRIEPALSGATSFPRHWVYDAEGALVQKSGTIDFAAWYGRAAGTAGTPWGDEDAPVFVAMAESELERALSRQLMGGGRPRVQSLDPGALLTRQGDPGDELHLVLDGVLTVEVDGQEVAEVGPGAVVGERAILEGGTRTATLRALTPVKVATARAESVDADALRALTALHRREDRDSRDEAP